MKTHTHTAQNEKKVRGGRKKHMLFGMGVRVHVHVRERDKVKKKLGTFPQDNVKS